METKLIRNIGLKLGSLAGTLIVVYFFVLYFSGISLFDPYYKADFWVTIPMISLGIWYIRKFNDTLRIWQGLIFGFYVFIVCASIGALFYYIFLTFIDPDFMVNSFNLRLNELEVAKDAAQNPEQVKYLEEAIVEIGRIRDEATPFDIAMDKILIHYIIGLIVTLVTSILFRK